MWGSSLIPAVRNCRWQVGSGQWTVRSAQWAVGSAYWQWPHHCHGHSCAACTQQAYPRMPTCVNVSSIDTFTTASCALSARDATSHLVKERPEGQWHATGARAQSKLKPLILAGSAYSRNMPVRAEACRACGSAQRVAGSPARGLSGMAILVSGWDRPGRTDCLGAAASRPWCWSCVWWCAGSTGKLLLRLSGGVGGCCFWPLRPLSCAVPAVSGASASQSLAESSSGSCACARVHQSASGPMCAGVGGVGVQLGAAGCSWVQHVADAG